LLKNDDPYHEEISANGMRRNQTAVYMAADEHDSKIIEDGEIGTWYHNFTLHRKDGGQFRIYVKLNPDGDPLSVSCVVQGTNSVAELLELIIPEGLMPVKIYGTAIVYKPFYDKLAEYGNELGFDSTDAVQLFTFITDQLNNQAELMAPLTLEQWLALRWTFLGHSLGGAIVQLVSYMVYNQTTWNTFQWYYFTCGCPKVGDSRFVSSLIDENIFNYITRSRCGDPGSLENWVFTLFGELSQKVTSTKDIVTHLPYGLERAGKDSYINLNQWALCSLNVAADFVARSISAIITDGSSQFAGSIFSEGLGFVDEGIANHALNNYATKMVSWSEGGDPVTGMGTRRLQLPVNYAGLTVG
jgi:hypothetical protein